MRHETACLVMDDRPDGIRKSLLKPFRVASALALIALLVALGALTYMAWSSAQKLDPLQRHLSHLQALQESSLDIQELIIRHIERSVAPTPDEVQALSIRLQQIIEDGDHLHPETPGKLSEARNFLDQTLERSADDPKVGLLAALTVIRQILIDENKLQDSAVGEAEAFARLEMILATIALLLVPAFTLMLLVYLRRRSFGSLRTLGSMLEHVGDLEFQLAAPADPTDPLQDVFERYNAMVEKLRQARDAADRHREDLELQVRTASETLLRQQNELADSARLAAIGEFSARVAHELRNPISGIAFALQNLETEIEDADHKSRINLILEELDRTGKLMTALLNRTPTAPEPPVAVNIRTLVGDVVKLFDYQLPPGIAVGQDVADTTCTVPRDTLRQVLLNLLRNAAEALGERAGHIWIAAEGRGGTLHLTVSDDGPGYPDDLLKYGIRPFMTGKTAGTGLGLAVIQRLVRSAGGELELARREGGGASALVSLPCKAMSDAHHDDH